MTIDTAHAELIRANLVGTLTEEDTLLWMTLIHTHRIDFAAPLLSDRPTITAIAALTQRGAAETAARLWEGRRRQLTATDWYHRFLTDAGYECVDDVPPERLSRLTELRDQLLSDPRITAVLPDD